MSEEKVYDLAIIGGGPAGYVGAIRAAQLGQSVICLERDKLGGICLNWGCIPTKALLGTAELYWKLKHDASSLGIQADNIRHDWKQVIARSRGVADNLNKGIAGLFKKNKIVHQIGHARIMKAPAQSSPAIIEVQETAGKPGRPVHAKRVLIATGAAPRSLPGADFDGDKVITSKEAMTLPEQPKRLIIVGAGAIGMEFAYFYNAFGTQVTVIELMDRVLPVEDEDVSKAVAKAFRKQGIDCRTSTKTTSVRTTANGVEVAVSPVVESGSKPETLTADKVLIAIGVRGRFDGLFDESLKIELFKDHIKVNKDTYQTSISGIYAVGDVIGPPWLAHVASEEAVVCVEQIAGHHSVAIDYGAIPGCTYCQPQVASIGLTEQACKQRGIAYQVGVFPFQASGKAQAAGHTEGFVKLIAGQKHGEILGVHMVGENVTEMIAEIALAMRLEATIGEVIATIHAHPTLSESVHEAALGAGGRMLHF
jgi:dihydrolipoamide dehydrogenase